jgi:hypothetical protein
VLVLRNFRRLPPQLRVVAIIGVLCTLTALAIQPMWLLVHLRIVGWLSSLPVPADFNRVLDIACYLALLGWACSLVITTYSLRFAQPHRETFPLRSWQRQMGALVLMTVTPLCGIAVALVVALAYPASFFIPGSIVVLAVIVLLAFNRRTVDGTANGEPLPTSQPQ